MLANIAAVGGRELGSHKLVCWRSGLGRIASFMVAIEAAGAIGVSGV